MSLVELTKGTFAADAKGQQNGYYKMIGLWNGFRRRAILAYGSLVKVRLDVPNLQRIMITDEFQIKLGAARLFSRRFLAFQSID